jgi:hypothetical protein
LYGQDLRKKFDRTIGSARTSKVAFAVLGTIGAFFPFLEYVVAPTPEALVSGISLSLAIGLAYIVFFSLQILPSFSSGESYTLLRSLPLSERDFSLVALLSFFRTFDYIAITTTLVQIVSVAILTRSLIATVMMTAGSLANSVRDGDRALVFGDFLPKCNSGRTISHREDRANSVSDNLGDSRYEHRIPVQFHKLCTSIFYKRDFRKHYPADWSCSLGITSFFYGTCYHERGLSGTLHIEATPAESHSPRAKIRPSTAFVLLYFWLFHSNFFRWSANFSVGRGNNTWIRDDFGETAGYKFLP